MGRYVPTEDQQMLIDRLTADGYKVVRARTYERLLERARVAETFQEFEAEHEAFNEQRRLRDRLEFVWGIALKHGVAIEGLGGCSDSTRCTYRGSTLGGGEG